MSMNIYILQVFYLQCIFADHSYKKMALYTHSDLFSYIAKEYRFYLLYYNYVIFKRLLTPF